jgi:serine/threonine protein kinase
MISVQKRTFFDQSDSPFDEADTTAGLPNLSAIWIVMTPKNVDELRDLLVRLRLVELEQFDECLARSGPSADDPAAVIAALEGRHLLTPFQISQIERGETDLLRLGKYKLLYKNGSGSFARVFRACSVENGEMVGLKLLRQRWAKDPQAVALFHREAELCKKFHHNNIVPIYEVAAEGDYHYFVMEFVVGGNLRDFLNIRKKLSPAEATRCILDLCEGLDYALARGISHRDLKLTNVLMNSEGVAKLVDFGLAGEESSGSGETFQQALEYATLEKGTGAPRRDPRSDLFFLGSIFYELLGGEPPYPRTRDREERKRLTRYSNVRPLRSVDPNIPRVVLQIVDRLMKLDPNLRYQTPAEVMADLRFALAELGDSPALRRANEPPVLKDNGTEAAPAQRALPTVMCIEGRTRQQDILREYLSKRGFRVLVLSDLQRGLSRLEKNPPDCVVLMGESIGAGAVGGFQEAVKLSGTKPTVCVLVLAERQSKWSEELEQTPSARVLVQPLSLRDLRREIHLAFQRLKHDSRIQKKSRRDGAS